MLNRSPAEILSECLVRDYLHRHKLEKCLQEFNKSKPITPETDTSTTELIESLRLGKYFKENQALQKSKRLTSLIEIMADFFCLPELKENIFEKEESFHPVENIVEKEVKNEVVPQLRIINMIYSSIYCA